MRVTSLLGAVAEMNESPAIVDRYLHLMQEVLINAIYQDRAIDPWSHPVFDSRKRDSGLDWPEQALTMIGRERLQSLRECCEIVLRDQVPGDFVETGIWRGGACIMMAAVLAAHGDLARLVWGFDSFQGLPPPNEAEYPKDRGDQLHRFPQLAVSIECVIENFKRMDLWSEQVRLVKGWFKDTVRPRGWRRSRFFGLMAICTSRRFRCWRGFIRSCRLGGFASLMIMGPC